MPDVLSACEDPEGQVVQEVPAAQKPCDRDQPEACLVAQVVVDVLDLRDVAPGEAAFLLHLVHCLQVLGAGVLLVQGREHVEDFLPGLSFCLRVGHSGDFFVGAVVR